MPVILTTIGCAIAGIATAKIPPTNPPKIIKNNPLSPAA